MQLLLYIITMSSSSVTFSGKSHENVRLFLRAMKAEVIQEDGLQSALAMRIVLRHLRDDASQWAISTDGFMDAKDFAAVQSVMVERYGVGVDITNVSEVILADGMASSVDRAHWRLLSALEATGLSLDVLSSVVPQNVRVRLLLRILPRHIVPALGDVSKEDYDEVLSVARRAERNGAAPVHQNVVTCGNTIGVGNFVQQEAVRQDWGGLKANCGPVIRKDRPQRQPQQHAKPKPVECYTCGERGHVSFKCPQRPRRNPSGQGVAAINHFPASTRRVTILPPTIDSAASSCRSSSSSVPVSSASSGGGGVRPLLLHQRSEDLITCLKAFSTLGTSDPVDAASVGDTFAASALCSSS